MQKTTTIGFIGAGNMAYALISGLINNGLEASNIRCLHIVKSCG
jgi:pyrroline-5-carboxylate reductase